MPFLNPAPPAAEGRGSLVDAHTVRVELSAGGTRTLTAKYILLALGGKPVKAPIPGAVSATTLAPCPGAWLRGLGMPQVLLTCAAMLPRPVLHSWHSNWQCH